MNYSSNSAKNMREKLTVAVRIKPIASDELDRSLFVLDDKTIVLQESDNLRNGRPKQRERRFIFDQILEEFASQEDVYECVVKDVVRDVLLGYNGAVFAYGATGCGKTYTMMGNNGMVFQAISHLFSMINNRFEQYTMFLSYVELYNENIRDLLNPQAGFLEIRDDSSSSSSLDHQHPNVVINGLTEIVITSTHQAKELLKRGNEERVIEATTINGYSSRSHAILYIIVKRTSPIHKADKIKTRIRQGKLYMVDLAGCERAAYVNNNGKRLQEGGHINRSLLALGNCINALANNSNSHSHTRYVNYRDSKLTRLLREPLSGNCRTVMIAHVTPSTTNREQTKNTLSYAARASTISLKVEQNISDTCEPVSEYRSIITQLRAEISRLNDKLENTVEKENTTSKNDALKLREKIMAMFREQMNLRRRLMDIDGHLLSLGLEMEKHQQLLREWSSKSSRPYQPIYRVQSIQNDESTTISNDKYEDKKITEVWSNLSYIEQEQERYVTLRSDCLKQLDDVRQRALQMENELPNQLESESERELLSLLCRVHELELDNMALYGDRVVESYELKRRGQLLRKFYKQQQITDNIITRQRQLMQSVNISVPEDVRQLYHDYQQQICSIVLSDTDTDTDTVLPSDNNFKLPKLLNNTIRFSKDMQWKGNESASSSSSLMTNYKSGGNTGKDAHSSGELPKVPNTSSASNGSHRIITMKSPVPSAMLFPPIAL